VGESACTKCRRERGKLTEHRKITEAAKELRHKPTEAEKKLWQKLKSKKINGVKFRREEPIGSYIVDFVNYENKLVIEVDGHPHREKEVKINDGYRTQWLESQGFRVIRFWDSEILKNTKEVLEKINLNI
jgi:5-methyltetrahydrofolate--homocysteine methyltransferase